MPFDSFSFHGGIRNVPLLERFPFNHNNSQRCDLVIFFSVIGKIEFLNEKRWIKARLKSIKIKRFV